MLILSADIGEGHDLPARALRDALLDRDPHGRVVIADTIETAGPLARALVRTGAETILTRARWLFDLQYWFVARFGPTWAFSGWLATAIAGRRLLALIERERVDVVVSTYPVATEVLGRLRLRGRLRVPVVSAVTDLAALRYWAHRACDLHLVIHPESAEEIHEVAGPGARVEAVRGLTGPAFDRPADPVAARAGLGLPAAAPVVVVSGGGWGVGDLGAAVDAALRAGPDVVVLALCGRNERLRAALGRRFAGESRVRVMGFTDRMPDVLAAADVLVHSTAGLTVFEALVRGARVISFGWGVAHIRANNRAYQRFGLAEVAADETELTPAVARALASPRRPDLAYGRRPDAAGAVLRLGGLQGGDRPRGAEDAAAREHQR